MIKIRANKVQILHGKGGVWQAPISPKHIFCIFIVPERIKDNYQAVNTF